MNALVLFCFVKHIVAAPVAGFAIPVLDNLIKIYIYMKTLMK